MTRNRHRPFTFGDAAIPTPRDRKVTSQRCQDALEVGRQGARFSDLQQGPATLDQPPRRPPPSHRQMTVPSASRRFVRCSEYPELDEKRKCSKRRRPQHLRQFGELAAIRRASSRVSKLAAVRRLLLDDIGQGMAVVVPHDEAGRVPRTEAQLGYKRLIQL